MLDRRLATRAQRLPRHSALLLRIRDLRGDRIHAEDGEVGSVDELYFDDEAWDVRYLAAPVGESGIFSRRRREIGFRRAKGVFLRYRFMKLG